MIVKKCLRCGEPVQRKVMMTAKYCSAECRAKSARDSYIKRQRASLILSFPARLSEKNLEGRVLGSHTTLQEPIGRK
jgi:hypothetical protein